MRSMPVSKVVQTDAEVAAGITAQIEAENHGQPRQWIDEEAAKAVAQELSERADLQRWQQNDYDRNPPVPHRILTPE